MNKIILTALMLAIVSCSFSQSVVIRTDSAKQPQVFTMVEQMPEFPGGEKALMEFIQQNTHYPAKERKKNIQGRVLIRFIVDEDGEIQDVQVVRSVSPALDKEAVRVVKLLPKFRPGKNQGKPVRVYFNLPFSFKLT